MLGMADAALGNKGGRDSRRPPCSRPITGKRKCHRGALLLIQYLAPYLCVDRREDLALGAAKYRGKAAQSLSYGQLRLHPYWDPLRGDPGFEKIVASLAPK